MYIHIMYISKEFKKKDIKWVYDFKFTAWNATENHEEWGVMQPARMDLPVERHLAGSDSWRVSLLVSEEYVLLMKEGPVI